MRCLTVVYLGVGVIWAALGTAPAAAGEHTDPSGYSVTFPDGWTAITRPGPELSAAAQKYLQNNPVDFSKISVLLLGTSAGAFTENVNVVVQPQEIPVNQDSINKLSAMLPKQFTSMGGKVESFAGKMQQVAGRQALVFAFNSRLPALPVGLWQRQVMVPGGGKSFIITFTCQAEDAGKHLPTFDTILASFKAPAPTGRGSGVNWNGVWSGALRGGIIGGIVGGLVAGLFAVKKLASKKKHD